MRVSTTQGQSTELQRREIDEYLKARGWIDITYYEDAGFTGTTIHRPQFKALMVAARGRKIDTVVVWRLDRYARSLKDLILNLEELSQLGVSFVSLKDHIDMTTAAGRLMFNMLGAFASFEAELIKERVRAGLLNAKAKGVRLGRPKVHDEEKIINLRNQGLSYRQIRKQLNVPMGTITKAIRSAQNTQLKKSAISQ